VAALADAGRCQNAIPGMTRIPTDAYARVDAADILRMMLPSV
jgi:hypothetical protein